MTDVTEDEIIKQIFEQPKGPIIDLILSTETSVSLNLLLMGFNRSCYDDKNQFTPIRCDRRWFHALAFSKSPKVIETLLDLLSKYPLYAADILLPIWYKKPSEALPWLEAIKSFDPSFNRLRLTSSPFVKKMEQKLGCKSNKIFTRLFFEDEEFSKKYIESIFQRLLTNEKELLEKNIHKDEIHKIYEERKQFLRSQRFSSEQADALFLKLWENNVKSMNKASTDLFNRNPVHVLAIYRDENGINPQYRHDIGDFFHLIPYLSNELELKIKRLYETLPFWKHNLFSIRLFDNLQLTMFKKNPELVTDDWIQLIQKDLSLAEAKVRGMNAYPYQVIPNEIVRGLDLIQDHIDSNFLISLTNHHNNLVREKVQELLKIKMD